jgi:hypothetical protein
MEKGKVRKNSRTVQLAGMEKGKVRKHKLKGRFSTVDLLVKVGCFVKSI